MSHCGVAMDTRLMYSAKFWRGKTLANQLLVRKILANTTVVLAGGKFGASYIVEYIYSAYCKSFRFTDRSGRIKKLFQLNNLCSRLWLSQLVSRHQTANFLRALILQTINAL